MALLIWQWVLIGVAVAFVAWLVAWFAIDWFKYR